MPDRFGVFFNIKRVPDLGLGLKPEFFALDFKNCIFIVENIKKSIFSRRREQ